MTDGGGDPRWRPFRVGALVVHLLFSVTFSALVIYSVFKSVLEMTPSAGRPGPEVYTSAQCVKGAQALFVELEAQRRVYADGSAARADHRFLQFRIDWLSRKKRLESGCGLERGERAELRRAFGALDRLVDLYTTESVQFASSIGGELDEMTRLMERLEGSAQGAGSKTE
jgi:hypothetical protein